MGKLFLGFCLERESIRLKKDVHNEQRPWTNDKVLHKYRFTNLDRSHDRGTKKLMQVLKHRSLDEAIYLTLLYRISGSNIKILEILELERFDNWFETVCSIRPLFRVDCYQAVWPKGEGKGLEFLTQVLPTFHLDVAKILYAIDNKVTLKQLSKLISDVFPKYGYNKLKFQSAECAKDFSEMLPWKIDRDSYCELGPGSYSMLQIMYPRLRRKEAMEKLISYHRNKEFNFNYAVLEHALCEFNKYSYILGGRIPGKSKLYRNNS